MGPKSKIFFSDADKAKSAPAKNKKQTSTSSKKVALKAGTKTTPKGKSSSNRSPVKSIMKKSTTSTGKSRPNSAKSNSTKVITSRPSSSKSSNRPQNKPTSVKTLITTAEILSDPKNKHPKQKEIKEILNVFNKGYVSIDKFSNVLYSLTF